MASNSSQFLDSSRCIDGSFSYARMVRCYIIIIIIIIVIIVIIIINTIS